MGALTSPKSLLLLKSKVDSLAGTRFNVALSISEYI
jgi:hypothetical protein